MNLTKRWAFFDKSYKVPQIRKDLEGHPEFLDFRILTSDWLEKINELSRFMEDLGMHKYGNVDGYDKVGWFDFEREKVRRMSDMLIDDKNWLNKQRKDFVLFIDEYDKRRGKNFIETFPEMEDFYNLCKKLRNQGKK